MSNLEDTLNDRGREYGNFDDQAAIAQDLKGIIHSCSGWDRLTPAQAEALDMIVHKISRILNGNPNNIDSWHDIQGYAAITEKSTLNKNRTKSFNFHHYKL